MDTKIFVQKLQSGFEYSKQHRNVSVAAIFFFAFLIAIGYFKISPLGLSDETAQLQQRNASLEEMVRQLSGVKPIEGLYSITGYVMRSNINRDGDSTIEIYAKEIRPEDRRLGQPEFIQMLSEISAGNSPNLKIITAKPDTKISLSAPPAETQLAPGAEQQSVETFTPVEYKDLYNSIGNNPVKVFVTTFSDPKANQRFIAYEITIYPLEIE